ncbi:MAG: hypothetical protein CL609_25240 [Anaerolineaceae bacterium]|nr:hypothetical protein [Anaerolineaceae bacterium]
MKVSQSDPRSIRTCTLLREAMINLTAEKKFTNLTVQDITKQAGLNRTTFYLHYSGINELLDDCTRTLFNQMRADIYGNELFDFQSDITVLEPFVSSVFYHLEQYEDFYRTILGKQGNPEFKSLFQALLSELIFEPIVESKNQQEIDWQTEMGLRFTCSGFVGVIVWWLEKRKPVSVKQISEQIVCDVLPDYLSLLSQKNVKE